jgi:hypothetical protein
MKAIQNNKLAIIGLFLGALLGYLYFHYIGCQSGSCAITSRPINSTLYGAVMGGLFLSLFSKGEKV